MTQRYLITVETRTDILPGSGESRPGVADNDSRYDQYGLPYMNAKTLKGHLREQMELLLHVAPNRYPGVSVESLLGEKDLYSEKDAARIRISSLTVSPAIQQRVAGAIQKGTVTSEEIADALSQVRSQTKIGEDGVVAQGSLRQSRQIRKGLQFVANVDADDLTDQEQHLLKDAVRAIQHIGTKKSKGLGEVASTITEISTPDGAATQIDGTGNTVVYQIRLVEPVKVGGNGSQTNEESLPYIPGSMVRGSLVGRLLSNGVVQESDLDTVLQGARFSDVLPTVNGLPLLTCPSIYYADKHARREAQRTGQVFKAFVRAPRELRDFEYNKTNGDEKPNPAVPQEGEQLVGRGKYASVQNGLALYSVQMTANLHVAVNAEGMFRYEAIASGQTYEGQIRCEDETTAQMLAQELAGTTIYLGGSRGSGYGRCEVMNVSRTDLKGEADRYGIRRKADGHILSIYALSNLILLDEHGEETSIIDPHLLETQLGITNVQWQRSYVSIHNTNGYNHKWQSGQIQRSAVAAGSILYYTYDGELNEDKATALEEAGVGLRREDGYGSILIAPDFSGGEETVDVNNLRAEAVADTPLDPNEEESRILQLIEDRINESREDLALREAALAYSEKHADDMKNFSMTQNTRLYSLLARLPENDAGKAQSAIRRFEDNLKNAAGRMYDETVLHYGDDKDGDPVSVRTLLSWMRGDKSLDEFADQEIPVDRISLTSDADGQGADRDTAFYQKARFLRLALYDMARKGGKA